MIKFHRRYWHLPVTALLLAVLAATGCATSPHPRLYTFVPHDHAGTEPVIHDASASSFTVQVGPVRVPAYLDRPGIVTRRHGAEVHSDPLHRWAMPLEGAVADVIGHALARALPDAFVDSNPHRLRVARGYSVRLDITRLDGAPGGAVILEARWQIYRDGEAMALRKVRHEVISKDDSYAHYIEAMQTALLAMSEEIARVIKTDRAG